MKCLVKGSVAAATTPEERNRFAAACRQFGSALATAGHEILIGSVDGRTVGPHLADGAKAVPGRTPVTVYTTDDDTAVGAFRTRPDLGGVEVRVHREQGSWAVAMLPAIQDADVAVLIGGGSGTVGVAYSARALRKPVLAIPSFGGAAREIWDLSAPEYEARYGLTPADVETLRETWSASTAGAAVRAAEQLARRSPSGSYAPQVALLAAALALAGLWVALFLRAVGLSNDVTTFLLLGIAALLGTGLRTAVRLHRAEAARVTAGDLLSGATTGVLLAFGLALVYLAGGLVLTGKYVTLAGPEDFTRVAVSMSVLGLTAGFLLDRTAEVLRRRLEGFTLE